MRRIASPELSIAVTTPSSPADSFETSIAAKEVIEQMRHSLGEHFLRLVELPEGWRRPGVIKRQDALLIVNPAPFVMRGGVLGNWIGRKKADDVLIANTAGLPVFVSHELPDYPEAIGQTLRKCSATPLGGDVSIENLVKRTLTARENPPQPWYNH